MNQRLSTREAFGNDSPATSSCEIFIFKIFEVGDENVVQLVDACLAWVLFPGLQKTG